MNNRKKLLTTKQLMSELQISEATLYRLIKEGMPIKIKKPRRFDLDEVIEWLSKKED